MGNVDDGELGEDERIELTAYHRQRDRVRARVSVRCHSFPCVSQATFRLLFEH